MKIWIVEWGDYDESYIAGVFDSEDKARAHAQTVLAFEQSESRRIHDPEEPPYEYGTDNVPITEWEVS